MGLSLRNKLIIISLVVLTPVLILLLQSYSSAYETQKNQVIADQVRVAEVVSVIVDDAFDEAVAIASSYASDPVVLSFNSERINEYLARLIPVFPDYDDPVGVFDAQGELVGSARALSQINVADREWFHAVMQTGQPVVSEVIISRGTGVPIVVAAAPITGTGGRLIGVTTSVLSLSHFTKQLESVERAPGQNIFLADRTGRLAFHTGMPDLTWEQRDVSGYELVQIALEGERFSSERTSGVFGDERMVIANPTPKYGWVVGISIPREVALAPVQESFRSSLVIFGLVAVLTIGIALVIAEFLLRPLRQLTESAIAFGRGQLDRRTGIKTGDELERLGESFNAMADEVQRAMRLREEFLSVAAHELRTPLTVIKGYSQLLLAKEDDEEKLKRLHLIVRQTNRMTELLDEMLLMSEIRTGHMELHREEVDLTVLAAEVTERMQLMTEKHRLQFHGEAPAIVDVDRSQIEVVLTNLIDNAIRYSPQGGNVEIMISITDGEAVTSVRDVGSGIPKEKQKHVFEPFFQLYPAIAGFGGMGLGLFISKEIISRHNGRIWFESKEGEGSIFYFSLPLASPH